MPVYVRTKVTARTRNKLGKLIKGISLATEKIAREELNDDSDAIIRVMQRYPAKLPNQVYIRTGLLGRSWKKKKVKAGFEISNNAARKGRPYAKYVVGDKMGNQQASIHQGRWKLLRDVVERYMSKIGKRLLKKVKFYINSARFTK